MNLICRLDLHKWVRVGITKPIRIKGDFIEREYIGHKAMGRCEKCGVRKLRNVTGSWEWWHCDEVTRDKYEEMFNSGEYQL